MAVTEQNLIDSYLLPRLGYLQNIEVFNHLGRVVAANTIQFPYDKWYSTVTPIFKLGGDIFTPDSYDGTLGTAIYSGLMAGDDITVDTSIMYFSNAELTSFFDSAMSYFNAAPPMSHYSYVTYPDNAYDYLTTYAYTLALTRILTDLMNWRARLIWTDPQALAGILQGIIQQNQSYLSAIMMNIKGRGLLTPHSISTGRWACPANVNESTWQQYTVLRV